MKVRGIKLKNFKRFSDAEISFEDERGLPRDLIVLVGPNGCGKSTVLQAIAAVLGTATGRLASPAALQWPGFDLGRAGRAWSTVPEVGLVVEIGEAEALATQRAFYALPEGQARKLSASGQPNFAAHLIEIVMQGDHLYDDGGSPLIDLKGRALARHINGDSKLFLDLVAEIGTVAWYTEHRSIGSISLDDLANGKSEPMTLDRLRAHLAQLQNFHGIVLQKRELRPGERDLYADLEARWRSVFPGRSFDGISISDDPSRVMEQPPFFLLDPEGRPYELGEMSGAERAIFPILFDFANWNIHNSVILIDELELHLHPPLQQALLRALPKLGRNNQFIITTHSDYVANLVPPGAVIHVGQEAR